MSLSAILRHVIVLAAVLTAATVVKADALFGVPELAQVMFLLEDDQCLAGCETQEWKITGIPFPAGFGAHSGSGDALFRFEGKPSYHCGSRGCVNAIVLRDATHLVVLRSDFGTISGVTSIPSAEALALLPRIGRASVYQRELQEINDLYLAKLGEWGFGIIGGEIAMLLAGLAAPTAAHAINPALGVITTTLALAELDQKARKASTAYLWQLLQIEADHGWPALRQLVDGDPRALRQLLAVYQDLDKVFQKVLAYQQQHPTRFALLSMIHRGPLAEIPDVADPLSAIDRVLRRHGNSLDDLNLLPALAQRARPSDTSDGDSAPGGTTPPGYLPDVTTHQGVSFTIEILQTIPRWPHAAEAYGISQYQHYNRRYFFADAVLTMKGLSTTGAVASLSLHRPVTVAQANWFAKALAWGTLPSLKTHGSAEVVYEETGDHGGGQRVVLRLGEDGRVTQITATLWTP